MDTHETERRHEGRRHPRLASAVTAATVTGLLTLAVPGAAVGSTEIDRFNDQFTVEADPFFSEQCGTEVDLAVDVHVTHHAFDDDPLRHRVEERGEVVFSSDQGTVIESWRHAGVHEVVEVLEEVEPGIFLASARVRVNGTISLRTPDGENLMRDAGTVTFEDMVLWDRAADTILGPLESSVSRVAGPHPLLDDATHIEAICEGVT